MRVLLVGATGLLGTEIKRTLEPQHEVIAASRKGSDVTVDISYKASIVAMFDKVGQVGAVVCVGGAAKFAPLDSLTDGDYEFSLENKLMGQVNLVRCAIGRVDEGGSVTLTSGVLAQQPIVGGAAVSIVNAGVEAFARVAALELQGKLRVNVVSPGWISETLESMGKDPSQGIAAADVAKVYQRAIDEAINGQTLLAAKT